jgi:acetyl esterase/lipase
MRMPQRKSFSKGASVAFALVIALVVLVALFFAHRAYRLKRKQAMLPAAAPTATSAPATELHDAVPPSEEKGAATKGNADTDGEGGSPTTTSIPKGQYGVKVVPDIVYATVGGKQLQLDLYLPVGVSGPTPFLLWMHGGSFIGGNRKGGADIGQAMAEHGFALAAVDYRLSSEAVFPAPANDVFAALRYLRANAVTYNLDKSKAALTGFSAGSVLATGAGVATERADITGTEGGNLDQSNKLTAVVDGFGSFYASDIDLFRPNTSAAGAAEFGCGTSLEDAACAPKIKSYFPQYNLDPKDPPFFIVHGEQDTTIPIQNSYDLKAAMEKAGIPVTLVADPKYGHGPDVYFAHLPEIFAFLDKVFK